MLAVASQRTFLLNIATLVADVVNGPNLGPVAFGPMEALPDPPRADNASCLVAWLQVA